LLPLILFRFFVDAQPGVTHSAFKGFLDTPLFFHVAPYELIGIQIRRIGLAKDVTPVGPPSDPHIIHLPYEAFVGPGGRPPPGIPFPPGFFHEICGGNAHKKASLFKLAGISRRPKIPHAQLTALNHIEALAFGPRSTTTGVCPFNP